MSAPVPQAKKRTHPWRAQGPTSAQRRDQDQRRQAVIPNHARMGVKG